MKIRIIGSIVCVVVISIIGWIVYDEMVDPSTKEGKYKNIDTLNKEYDSVIKGKADTLKVYFEGSSSMDGYINGVTSFKTLTNQIVGKVLSEDIDGQASVCNYIAKDTVLPLDTNNYIRFFKRLDSSETFKNRLSDHRGTTQLTELIEKIIDNTTGNNVSMFVSDCVFSPKRAEDIEYALGIQTTSMESILSKKLKSDPTFGVLVYRCEEPRFDGIYYDKMDREIYLKKEPRPYFIWFFGKTNHLADIRKSLEKEILKDNEPFVATNGYNGHVPYYVSKSLDGMHISKVKVDDGKGKKIEVLFDFSKIPYSESYFANNANFKINDDDKNKVAIVKNESSTKNKKEYSHKVELFIAYKGYGMMPNKNITLSLDRPKMPSWVSQYNDSIGEDYKVGMNDNELPDTAKTFGIESLIKGVYNSYKDTPIVTAKIIIN